jgi:predicted  nucleic acid-binding Zn-ribbon protein
MTYDLIKEIKALHDEVDVLQDKMNNLKKEFEGYGISVLVDQIERNQREVRLKIKRLQSKLDKKVDELHFLKSVAA